MTQIVVVLAQQPLLQAVVLRIVMLVPLLPQWLQIKGREMNKLKNQASFQISSVEVHPQVLHMAKRVGMLHQVVQEGLAAQLDMQVAVVN
jgi:hypothetical protein